MTFEYEKGLELLNEMKTCNDWKELSHNNNTTTKDPNINIIEGMNTIELKLLQPGPIATNNNGGLPWYIIASSFGDDVQSIFKRAMNHYIISSNELMYSLTERLLSKFTNDFIVKFPSSSIVPTLSIISKIPFHLRLKVGDRVSCSDSEREWRNAEIIKATSTHLLIHYIGWSNKWNGTYLSLLSLLSPLSLSLSLSLFSLLLFSFSTSQIICMCMLVWD
jgi:hypothetical protein